MNAHSTESDALLTSAEVAAISHGDSKTLVSGALQVTATASAQRVAADTEARGHDVWAPSA